MTSYYTALGKGKWIIWRSLCCWKIIACTVPPLCWAWLFRLDWRWRYQGLIWLRLFGQVHSPMRALGIDLRIADYVILSHGHKDPLAASNISSNTTRKGYSQKTGLPHLHEDIFLKRYNFKRTALPAWMSTVKSWSSILRSGFLPVRCD